MLETGVLRAPHESLEAPHQSQLPRNLQSYQVISELMLEHLAGKDQGYVCNERPTGCLIR
jgi:hypothetical protein